MNQDIFTSIDKKKINTSLYPKETEKLLSDLLKLIGVEFNSSTKFNDQFLGRTKEEYEKMLDYIFDLFLNIKDLTSEKGSVKFVLFRILDTVILKNLDSFDYFNKYSDEDSRKIRTCLEEALEYIYKSKFVSETYIEESEVSKLLADGDVYTDDKGIYKALQTTKNKSRYVYSLKTNDDLFPEETSFQNLETIANKKPSRISISVEDLKGVYSENLKEVEPKDYIKELLVKSESFYQLPNGHVKKTGGDENYILSTDLNELKAKKNRLKIEKYNLTLSLNTQLFDYYKSLITYGFTRYGGMNEWGEVIYREIQLKGNIKPYLGLQNEEHTKSITKYGIDSDLPKITQLERKGRVYKEGLEIYQNLLESSPSEVLTVTFDDEVTILATKDLNYFFLLNQDLVESIKYKDTKLQNDKKERLFFDLPLLGGKIFSKYIDVFLEYQHEDYQYNYQDVPLLKLLSSNFGKKEILSYTKDQREKLKDLEEISNFSKIIPKSLL